MEDCFGDSLLTQEKEEDEDLACSAENIGEDEAEGGEDGNGNGNDLNIRLGKRRSISVSSKNSKVSEGSERALMKTSILAMELAKWLQPPTSTTKLTHSIQFFRLARLPPDSLKMRLASLCAELDQDGDRR